MLYKFTFIIIVITFVAADHRRPPTITKLYCLVTGICVVCPGPYSAAQWGEIRTHNLFGYASDAVLLAYRDMACGLKLYCIGSRQISTKNIAESWMVVMKIPFN